MFCGRPQGRLEPDGKLVMYDAGRIWGTSSRPRDSARRSWRLFAPALTSRGAASASVWAVGSHCVLRVSGGGTRRRRPPASVGPRDIRRRFSESGFGGLQRAGRLASMVRRAEACWRPPSDFCLRCGLTRGSGPLGLEDGRVCRCRGCSAPGGQRLTRPENCRPLGVLYAILPPDYFAQIPWICTHA